RVQQQRQHGRLDLPHPCGGPHRTGCVYTEQHEVAFLALAYCEPQVRVPQRHAGATTCPMPLPRRRRQDGSEQVGRTRAHFSVAGRTVGHGTARIGHGRRASTPRSLTSARHGEEFGPVRCLGLDRTLRARGRLSLVIRGVVRARRLLLALLLTPRLTVLRLWRARPTTRAVVLRPSSVGAVGTVGTVRPVVRAIAAVS